ncbi:MAG TPA: hypothetical protein VLJ38_00965 [Polyangiaceae bacterium]|nr:hypothetical protein [Polyangiaceae bacterium]
MNDAARRRTFTFTAAAVVLGAVLAVTRQRASTPQPARTETPVAPTPPSDTPPVAETASTPSASAAPLTASARPIPPARDASATFDEAELMRELRSARGNDPALAAELAREGNRRFPASPAAPERASILIHALSEQGLNSEARAEAEDMVNRYPDSHWVQEIERFTGAHRHRNVRVDEQGRLRFYDPAPG